ncbi:hypothetical protein HZB78_00275 [Candidatus Collierbacteria bacterium]|nr:hypothetical protein [Candidatus Collierbacteria bacterium]
MPITAEDSLKLPPIVKEIAGVDDKRLGATALAYNFLWQKSCGAEEGLKEAIDSLVTKHPWLETPISIDQAGLNPLQKIRLSIEKEKLALSAKGFNPCADHSLN